jgi:hypothetical protein
MGLSLINWDTELHFGSLKAHNKAPRNCDIYARLDMSSFLKRREIIHYYLLTLYPNAVNTDNGNTVTETLARVTSVDGLQKQQFQHWALTL